MSFKPYDAEIEYLESRGGAYIDSGYKHNTKYEIECRFRCIGESNNLSAPFGTWNIANNKRTCLRILWRNTTFTFQYKSNTISQTGNSNWNTWIESRIADNKVYMDAAVFNASKENDATSSIPFVFFGSFSNGSGTTTLENHTTDTSFIQISKAKMLLNNVLLRDFIPVRVGTTGYMYDKISGTLFGNAGTGNFILGPDK
jgi:hypothetical protein